MPIIFAIIFMWENISNKKKIMGLDENNKLSITITNVNKLKQKL